MRWFFILSGVITWTGNPVRSSCPIEMSPPKAVVRYGDPLLNLCSSTSDQIRLMGWEAIYAGTGSVQGVSSVRLNIEAVKDYDFEPVCFITLISGFQCLQSLPVTVYKTPDSVSMSLPSQTGPMVEGKQYSLECDVVNVAPVRNLSVHWHKGNKIIHSETYDHSRQKPDNVSSIFNLTVHRADNGIQIWCEAKLDFGPSVPNPPAVRSKSHEVTVLYSPAFMKAENETLELSAGSEIILDCTATGNPTPVYSWHFPHSIQQTTGNENGPVVTPAIKLPGTYNCTASNNQGTKTKYFTVIEAPRNRTTLAALLGGFLCLAVVLFIGGLFFLTPDGTFSFSKGGYMKGRPAPSGPV